MIFSKRKTFRRIILHFSSAGRYRTAPKICPSACNSIFTSCVHIFTSCVHIFTSTEYIFTSCEYSLRCCSARFADFPPTVWNRPPKIFFANTRGVSDICCTFAASILLYDYPQQYHQSSFQHELHEIHESVEARAHLTKHLDGDE